MSGLRRQNYKMPTPIQRNTLPLTLQGKDIMAMARTGTYFG
jgi:superfamily II DNA/RNA helicase